MAEFRLPKNSKVKKGKHHKATGGGQMATFKVYRWSPYDDENPRTAIERIRDALKD